jgi:hypothetical protein
VSPMRYELGFYIPEDGIHCSHRRESLKSYIAFTGWALWRRNILSPVRFELGLHIPGDGILHCHRRDNLKSYKLLIMIISFHTELSASLTGSKFSM